MRRGRATDRPTPFEGFFDYGNDDYWSPPGGPPLGWWTVDQSRFLCADVACNVPSPAEARLRLRTSVVRRADRWTVDARVTGAGRALLTISCRPRRGETAARSGHALCRLGQVDDVDQVPLLPGELRLASHDVGGQFAVADGVGGLHHGGRASRELIVGLIAQDVPEPDLAACSPARYDLSSSFACLRSWARLGLAGRVRVGAE